MSILRTCLPVVDFVVADFGKMVPAYKTLQHFLITTEMSKKCTQTSVIDHVSILLCTLNLSISRLASIGSA